ncbi:Endoglucanase F, partial [Lamellibrachia satsuma]
LLYYMATNKAEYKAAVENFLSPWFPGGNVPKSPQGLAFRDAWGSLRYSANTAFLALVAADNGIHTTAGRAFAKTQLEYMLGSTGRSFVVGYGTNPPVQPHHSA